MTTSFERIKYNYEYNSLINCCVFQPFLIHGSAGPKKIWRQSGWESMIYLMYLIQKEMMHDALVFFETSLICFEVHNEFKFTFCFWSPAQNVFLLSGMA